MRELEAKCISEAEAIQGEHDTRGYGSQEDTLDTRGYASREDNTLEVEQNRVVSNCVFFSRVVSNRVRVCPL